MCEYISTDSQVVIQLHKNYQELLLSSLYLLLLKYVRLNSKYMLQLPAPRNKAILSLNLSLTPISLLKFVCFILKSFL